MKSIIVATACLSISSVVASHSYSTQTADPFGDPVQGMHNSADTELLLGAIHSAWPREEHAILAGANPNIRDKSGVPFLIWHMQTDQDVEHLRFIKAHGADVNIRDSKNGHTPIMLASNPESIAFLISAGANLEERDSKGLNALFHALSRWQYFNAGVTATSVTDSVKELLAAGAEATAKDSEGENVLFYFVRMGHEYHKSCINCPDADPIAIIQALKAAGVDPNRSEQIHGYAGPTTLLAWSTFYNPDVTMFRALLKTGMQPDDLLKNGTFFHNVEQACGECATYTKKTYPSAFTSRTTVAAQPTETGKVPKSAGAVQTATTGILTAPHAHGECHVDQCYRPGVPFADASNYCASCVTLTAYLPLTAQVVGIRCLSTATTAGGPDSPNIQVVPCGALDGWATFDRPVQSTSPTNTIVTTVFHNRSHNRARDVELQVDYK
jgi:hypothetical protein